MKKILVLAALFFLTSCGGAVISLEKQKFQFQEVQIADKKYYFKYPAEAIVDLREAEVSYKDCLVINFEQNPDFDSQFGDLKLEKNNSGDITYKAWYQNDQLAVYAGTISDVNFHFFVADDPVSVNCMELVQSLAESFSDELIYINENVGFSAKLPADFKVEYLPGGTGIILKKWIEKKIEVVSTRPKDKKEVDVFEPYKVEMGITTLENFEEFENIGDFVGKNYSGYTIEFKDFEKFSGYLVNETVVLDAVSHFFVLSPGGDIIYDIYLGVPGKRYAAHQKEFEEFVKGVEI